MIYRFARPSDGPAVLAVYEPYIRNTAITFEYQVPSPEEFSRRISSIIKRYPYLACEENGMILGYAYASSYRSRAAFQWDVEVSIYLRPEAQGKGVAKGLYRRLLPMLEALGYRNVYASIVPPNPQSIGLHKHFGFKETALFEKTGYKLGQWWDLLWMVLRMNDSDQPPAPPRSVGELENAERFLFPQDNEH